MRYNPYCYPPSPEMRVGWSGPRGPVASRHVSLPSHHHLNNTIPQSHSLYHQAPCGHNQNDQVYDVASVVKLAKSRGFSCDVPGFIIREYRARIQIKHSHRESFQNSR